MESSMKEDEDSFQPVRRNRRGRKRGGQHQPNPATTPALVVGGPYSPPSLSCEEMRAETVLRPVKDDLTLLPSTPGADPSDEEGDEQDEGAPRQERLDDQMAGENEDAAKLNRSDPSQVEENHPHEHKKSSEQTSVNLHSEDSSSSSSASTSSPPFSASSYSSSHPSNLSATGRKPIKGASSSSFSSTNKRPPPASSRFEVRRLLVPQHRLSPLRKHWTEIVEPLVTHLKLQVRMNTKRRCIELRCRIHDGPEQQKRSSNSVGIVADNNTSRIYLQKGNDFVKAFLLGFELRDAVALLRLDDLFIESFEVKDVKRLSGDHLSRCLARLNGREGKTKYAIENSTRTRLVFADTRIHILGSFENIKLARHSICSLILGTPPGKVYNHLRTVTRRLAERL